MSILCATDFSESARSASRVAALLAARRHRPLWLVHRAAPEALSAAPGPVREGLKALLHEDAARLAPLHADIHTALLEGTLPEVLARFAEKEGARMLVVGAPRDRGPFEGAGGSLDRIAQATALPLLRVRDASPFEAWLGGKRPLRVLFAVNRSRGVEAARAWLAELQLAGPLEIFAGHVFYAIDECRRLGLPLPLTYDGASPELREALGREVAALAQVGPGEEPVQVRMRAGLGRAADDVVDLAEEVEADLLVVGMHPHSAVSKLWSVAHHALRLAPMAVAAVPARAAASRGEAALPRVQRLLVATDLSARSDEVIPFALALAPPGSQMHLVTVQAGEPTLEERRALERQLRQRLPPMTEERGVEAQVQVLAGENVALALIQAAERLDAHLICLGSRGRGTLGRALLGSVAQQVLSHSRRPVLVLRPPAG